MGKIIISVDEHLLSEIDDYTILNISIEEYIKNRRMNILCKCIPYSEELSDYEQSEILDTMIAAITQQNTPASEEDKWDPNYISGDLGIMVDIHLGRSPHNGMRTYELDDCEIVSADDCDISVADFLKECENG